MNMNARFDAGYAGKATRPAADPVSPAMTEEEAALRRKLAARDPRNAMGAAAEAFGEVSRTWPMRLAVNGALLVIWAFVGLLGFAVFG